MKFPRIPLHCALVGDGSQPPVNQQLPIATNPSILDQYCCLQPTFLNDEHLVFFMIFARRFDDKNILVLARGLPLKKSLDSKSSPSRLRGFFPPVDPFFEGPSVSSWVLFLPRCNPIPLLPGSSKKTAIHRKHHRCRHYPRSPQLQSCAWKCRTL